MPRACPVVFYAGRYNPGGCGLLMPRACPVEIHVESYSSAQRESPRDKPVASAEECRPHSN
jgi:hypothetical protein